MKQFDRRRFLATSATLAGAAAIAPSTAARAATVRTKRSLPVAISSGNGLRTVERAIEMVTNGTDPVLAAVEGVGIVEADPDDMTVGLGGLPNERGVVELDSSVMHGPTHKAGAVASLRNILHPAQVALKVLQITDHVLLVGEGALEFARANGFPEQNLLTPRAREAWLRWKRSTTPSDDWLDDDQLDWDAAGKKHTHLDLDDLDWQQFDPPPPGWPEGVPFTYGTIHCGVIAPDSNVAACTTTSGLAFKIPGRVGDSPIIGAGMYCDNEVGTAGATGRGEAAIQNCTSFAVVQQMAAGKHPTDACLAVLKDVARRSIMQKRHRDNRPGRDGIPNFGLTLYAAHKDGRYGSANMLGGGRFAVADTNGPRLEDCAALYERE